MKAVVDAGRYGRKIVVCGAPNCRPGIRTVYVPLGRRSFPESKATACWPARPNSRSTAITPASSNCGADQEIPLPDSVIEIDNKSITHRPDLWGHHGMAREVAAITGKQLRDPVMAG